MCAFPSTAPASAEGEWVLVSGTGKYAGIQGHGKILATVDFATGEVTISREGEVLP